MIKFNNVYVKNTALVAGKMESNSKYGDYFDKKYKSFYIDKKSLEKSEVLMQKDSIDILLDKENLEKDNIDFFVGGDLLNQICATSYAMNQYKVPFLGVFSACATSMESIIIASSFIESKSVNKVICTTSSHNLNSEKQFRNPIEYGSFKRKTSTFTATGAASILLTNEKTDVKVTSGTIGKIISLKQNDPNNMGAAMAPAAANTIYRHLKYNNETIDDYDLIITGDLGLYGSKILREYIKKEYNIELGEKYNDCGAMLYDKEKYKEVESGGSGPVCSALINYGYIYDLLKHKRLKKVMFVTTGALFSPTFLYQKEDILGIAHAVTMEGV